MAKCYPEELIKLAKAEVGYKEKASDAYLDDKEKNAGKANYTKYAHDIDVNYPKFYNGRKNGFDWCAVFVDWLFIKAYGYDNALRLTCQPENSYGASCTMSMNYFIEKKRFSQTPKLGDQIFFGDGSTSSHTGVVVGIDGDTIKTVEGNADNAVREKSYKKSDSKIMGYGHPDYDTQSTGEYVITVDKTKYSKIVINLE